MGALRIAILMVLGVVAADTSLGIIYSGVRCSDPYTPDVHLRWQIFGALCGLTVEILIWRAGLSLKPPTNGDKSKP